MARDAGTGTRDGRQRGRSASSLLIDRRSALTACQLGRIVVVPVQETERENAPGAPLMLLALNATDAVGWDDLQAKVACRLRRRARPLTSATQAKVLASHLATPLSRYREHLAVNPALPLSAAVSPDRPSR